MFYKCIQKEKEQEWEKGKKEAQEKLDEAQQKLTDANDEIGKIEKAKWYINRLIIEQKTDVKK